jgi:hypothetical protein
MPTISNCDDYLSERTGKYEWRRVRYLAALEAMKPNLLDADTVVDFGAGMTELDYCLRVDGDWRGRYIPLDGGIDGIDLNDWRPVRPVEWIVALEIVEHLREPKHAMLRMQRTASKGVIISTPNPATVDVLGMDPTHVSMVTADDFCEFGFTVAPRSFYGAPNDSLFATWTPA